MKRIGSCKKCGSCCIGMVIRGDISAGVDKSKLTKEGKACEYLTINKGVASCSIYSKRPLQCRDHPLDPEDANINCPGYEWVITASDMHYIIEETKIRSLVKYEQDAESFIKKQKEG